MKPITHWLGYNVCQKQVYFNIWSHTGLKLWSPGKILCLAFDFSRSLYYNTMGAPPEMMLVVVTTAFKCIGPLTRQPYLMRGIENKLFFVIIAVKGHELS